jgi:ABC-type sugar transport system ATPase subunit
VLLISSEMEELERLCDRVLVLSKGEIKKELCRNKGDEITETVLAEAIQTA